MDLHFRKASTVGVSTSEVSELCFVHSLTDKIILIVAVYILSNEAVENFISFLRARLKYITVKGTKLLKTDEDKLAIILSSYCNTNFASEVQLPLA